MRFLSKILPSVGVYCVGTLSNGFFKNHFYNTIADMEAAITSFDAQGVTVYHACATYKEGGSRKADNAGWMKSFWLDIDVGKANDNNSYDTIQEAWAEFKKASQTLRLPPPTVVKSGKGLHIYFTLDQHITKEQWLPVAGALYNAFASVGFKQDPTRTRDAASVLRPVGSTWRKGEEQITVEMLGASPDVPLSAFVHIVNEFAEPVVPAAAGMFAMSEDLGSVEYPPSSAYKLIQFCGAIREVAEKRGAVTEPLWRSMIGVVKHTNEGEELCHTWSQGDPRYTYEETQRKIDSWATGPATCDSIATNCTACGTCPHRGSIKSPIQLGMVIEEAQVIEVPTTTTVDVGADTAEPEPVVQYKLPQGYHWNDFNLCALVPDNEGVVQIVPFATQLFVIYDRVRDASGVMFAKARRMVYKNEWRDFQFPMEVIANKPQLCAAFAANEIFTVGKSGGDKLTQIVQDFIRGLIHQKVETVVYDGLGWADLSSQFVLGDVAITKNGAVPTTISEATKTILKSSVGVSLGATSGTADGWIERVDTLYNHPGAEGAQFVILSGFASPLIELMGLSGWHGIPITVYGKTGLGKTRVANVASSIYGPPSALQLQGSIGRAGGNTTYNGLIDAISRAKNLPYVIDEITGISKEDLSSLLYDIAAGQSKIRLNAKGEPVQSSKKRWALIPLISTQTDLDNNLLGTKAAVHEATSLRCFTINVESDSGWDVTRDAAMVEDLVNNYYGTIGHDYLQRIMSSSKGIADRARDYVSKYSPKGVPPEARYMCRLVATVLFAGHLATRLGYVKFNIEAIEKWAIAQIDRMAARRGGTLFTVHDQLAAFMADISNAVIVTNSLGDGRSEYEEPLVPIHAPPVARKVLNKRTGGAGRFIVARKAISDWCGSNNVDQAWFLAELKRAGYIKEAGKDESVTGQLFRLGSGTPRTLPPARVIEFDTAMLSGFKNQVEVVGNVIKLGS